MLDGPARPVGTDHWRGTGAFGQGPTERNRIIVTSPRDPPIPANGQIPQPQRPVVTEPLRSSIGYETSTFPSSSTKAKRRAAETDGLVGRCCVEVSSGLVLHPSRANSCLRSCQPDNRRRSAAMLPLRRRLPAKWR